MKRGRTLFTPETRHLGAKVLARIRRLHAARTPSNVRIPTEAEQKAYNIAERHGLFDEDSVNDLNGPDLSNVEARKIATATSPFLVYLSSPSDGFRRLTSSGIIVEFHGEKKVLTSTYIVGDRSENAIMDLVVTIILPNKKEVTGSVYAYSAHYNIMIIHVELYEDPAVKAATFDFSHFKLGTKVTAVSRNYESLLRASSGEINIRNDHYESDDLLSSSCSITECGIGGPLISNSSGFVVGMNFFCKKGFTPFMPSNLIQTYMDLVITRGTFVHLHPWIGLKTRSLPELKIEELELLFMTVNCPSGLIVREVIKGSPAELVGICVGDVIVSCNNAPIHSQFELAEILLRQPRIYGGIEVCILKMSTRTTERKLIHVEMSDHPNRWPLW